MEKLKYLDDYLNISIYCGLLTLIVLIIYYKKLNQGERSIAHVVFLYVICDFVATFLTIICGENLWFYNWALIPQLLLVTFVMVRGMKRSAIKRLLIGGSLILAIFHVFNLLFFQGFLILANFTYIPTYGWMSIISFYFLREQLEDVNLIPFNFLITWFALATLIDVAGSLPVLSILGWSEFISQAVAYQLYDLVTWLYAGWHLIILTGLLWTKTSLRLVFYSR